jgi:diaminopimelate decarboxylase
MASFTYKNGVLHAEHLSCLALAQQYGTPTYIYSHQALCENYAAYEKGCFNAQGQRQAHIHFAVKSNSNLAVLQTFAQLGAGFDIVSGGELKRVLAAGGKAEKVVFSGVGKTREDMRFALNAGVFCFNVESIPELHRLNEVAAELNVYAPVSLRINPNVDAGSHPYISTGLRDNKFGVAFEDVLETYRTAARLPHLKIMGIDCHIGSQITEVSPYLDAIDRVLELVEALEQEGILIHHLDVGGGLGICYHDETPPAITDFVQTILRHIAERGHGHRAVLFEPGRSLVGNAGILLTQVEYLKMGATKNFCIVDAAMNDLARPAMYEAFHAIEPVLEMEQGPLITYDVVGPVCESGDWLGRSRDLAVQERDILAIRSAGAYGFVMSSNYNSRGRAAEIMVKGSSAYIVREREQITDLFRQEYLLP